MRQVDPVQSVNTFTKHSKSLVWQMSRLVKDEQEVTYLQKRMRHT